MKKILTLIVATAAIKFSVAAHAQGAVNFENYQDLNGQLVDLDVNGTYSFATSFTVALYYDPTTTLTSAGNQNANGYLTYQNLVADGFDLSATAQAVGSSDPGVFEGGTATLGVAGGYSGGAYTVDDVLALAAWTGNYATLAEAVAAGAAYGIITFDNPVGPGGSAPQVPYLTGWNGLTPTPGVETFEGSSQYPDLVMTSPVPEPGTMALSALGGLSLFFFRRKK